MPSYPALTGLSLGRGHQTAVELENGLLPLCAVERYTLRYGIR